MKPSRVSLSAVVLLTFLLCQGLSNAKTMAVLEKANAPSWYGAYLLPNEQGGENLATLRKGLEVEVLEKGSRRFKVKVLDTTSSKVIIHKSSWPGNDGATGWITPIFLRLLPEQEEAREQEEAQEQEDDGGGGIGGFFSDLFRRGDDDEAQEGEDQVEEQTSQPQDGGTASHSGPSLGREGSDPGAEAWRDELESVYYVFADLGKDGGYFTLLAEGRTHLQAYDNNSRRRNYKNHITAMIKRDISRVGRRNCKVVRIAVEDPSTVMEVLSEGMLPPGAVDRHRLYNINELSPVPCNIVGFCTITHASTDGPVFGEESNRKQITRRSFSDDAFSRSSSLETLDHRLVKGARISFFGCNTGSCQYYKDHSSIAHILAALYSRKKVITRGKKGIGSPNVSKSSYAVFGLDEEGIPRRLSPTKKKYLFYVPLRDYSNQDSGRKWVYESISVPFSSEEEKKEILDYYQGRGVRTKVEDGMIVADAPKIGKVSHNSKKDPLLLDIVRAIGKRKKLHWGQKILRYFGWLDDTKEIARVKAMQPFLEKIIEDRELQNIIEEVKEENGGKLDENDFRIWFRIYFQNYENKNDRGSIAYRACLCDDENLKRK